jgi:hypothetical protein
MIYGLPGDVFFTHSQSLLGSLIRWAEHDPNEPNGAWANHVGVVVSPGWIVPPPGVGNLRFTQATVIESLWKTERWRWWENHKDEKGQLIRVFRHRSLTPGQLRAIEHTANEFVGRTYGWWKLFAHLADRIVFGGKKTVSNWLVIEKRPICSFTVAHAFDAAKVSFGMDPDAADPDEMMDHCITSGDWVYVGEGEVK